MDAKVSESDDDEGHTMTTEFNSENNIDYSSWTDSNVLSPIPWGKIELNLKIGKKRSTT